MHFVLYTLVLCWNAVGTLYFHTLVLWYFVTWYFSAMHLVHCTFILMLEHHSPTHSCDPTVLCSIGEGIVSVLHLESFVCFVLRHSILSFRCPTHSYLSIVLCLVGVLSSIVLIVRHRALVGSASSSVYCAWGTRPWDLFNHIFCKYHICGI
jgi:hypothetical protein